jgi:hypothetical protein
MIKFITKHIIIIVVAIILISLSFQWFRSWKKQKISDLTDTLYAEAGQAIAKKL